MMKGLAFSLLLALALALALSPAPSARAQSAEESISTLHVALWPDFDRPAVLVILTGSLPPGASLPAEVTLPFPDNGQLNAVARANSDGRLIDDIEFSRSPGEIKLTTPDPRFRVEYYFPYEADGKRRTFNFTWAARAAIGEFILAVQQPIGADALVTLPGAVDMTPGEHGMQNHLLPSQALPAGQEFSVQVSYEMLAPHLSVEAFSRPVSPKSAAPSSTPAAAAAPSSPSAPAAPTISSWAVILGISSVALITLLVFWQIGRMRTARGIPSASERPTAEGATVNFCHSCGHSVQPADNFCFSCGTKLA